MDPIGDDTTGHRFTGLFNGNGFIIDNLFINRPSAIASLFRAIGSGAHITAVGVRNVTITGAHGTAALVGTNQGGVITASFSTGSITGAWGTGGLVGYNGGTVLASHSSAAVTGSGEAVGGLVGANAGTAGVIRASYARGSVTSVARSRVAGGLTGYNRSGATTPNSYWDSSIVSAAGEVGSSGAVGKTTAQLRSPTSYASTAGNGATAIYTHWNVDVDNADGDNTLTTGADDPWDFGTGADYPVLQYGNFIPTMQRSSPAVTGVGLSTQSDTGARG